MRVEDVEPLLVRGGAEDAAERVVQATGAVVRGAELELMGAFGDPGGMLEYAAEALDEFCARHARGPERWRLVGMRLLPVAGDVDAARQPDLLMRLDVGNESLQRRDAAGAADQPAMQADIHHARPPGAALLVVRVERIPEIGEELVAGVEALRRREAHVVGVERVGDDELRPHLVAVAVMIQPIRQFVVIGVGHIFEAAILGDKSHRVGGRASGVPAGRPLSCHLGVQSDRRLQVAPLVLDLVVAVVDPFQAMRGDLPAGVLHGSNLVGRAGESRCDAIHSDRHFGLGEDAVQPPEAGARAIFVDRFHVPVALSRPGLRADDFRQERFRGGVAMQHAVLATFLVVDDELHRDAGAARPLGIGRIGAIAAHVSDVTHGPPLPAGAGLVI